VRVEAARRFSRGDERLGISDGRFHAGDVGTHLCEQGPHLGPLRPEGVAVTRFRSRLRCATARQARLRCASAFAKASADKSPWQARLRLAWRVRFSNIIVIRLPAHRRGTPSPFAPPDAPPHRFDEKRGRLG
jgi:hypothetical protein